MMQVGGAVGLAAINTISSTFAQGIAGFQLAYVLAAVCVAAALAVVLVVLRAPREARAETPVSTHAREAA
jgi:hypothetical protein